MFAETYSVQQFKEIYKSFFKFVFKVVKLN